MAFDPHAPYSSTMDDVPLKLLFPKLKNRRRGSKKTKEMASLAKPVADPSNNNQNKAQESHASAVERSVVEQNKKENTLEVNHILKSLKTVHISICELQEQKIFR